MVQQIFNKDNVNPLYVLNIALKGRYNAIIFQKGIAEKYKKEIKKSKVPLILKLNGNEKLKKMLLNTQNIDIIAPFISYF